MVIRRILIRTSKLQTGTQNRRKRVKHMADYETQIVVIAGGPSGLSAAVQFFTEQPAIHTTPFTKAFPDLRDAAKAVIALKNYRKL